MVATGQKEKNWDQVVKAFQVALGTDKVVRRKEELLVYECDGLTSYRQRPAIVVLPNSTAEVAAAVKVCHQFQVPFVARGAGTGLSGGALPPGGLGVNCYGHHAQHPRHRSGQPAGSGTARRHQ